MNNLKIKSSLMVILLMGVFGLASCDKMNNPVDDGSGNPPDFTPFSVVSYDATECDFHEGSLTEDINLEPIMPMGVDHMDRRGKDDMRKDDKRPNTGFEFIFRKLNLSTEQRDSMKVYFAAHKDCVSAWLTMLRDSQMEIIQAARTEQKAIMAAYKAGELTREEAGLELRALNASTKAALKDNPINELVQAGMKDCNDELIAKIKSQLTDEQLVIFEEWIARMPIRR